MALQRCSLFVLRMSSKNLSYRVEEWSCSKANRFAWRASFYRGSGETGTVRNVQMSARTVS